MAVIIEHPNVMTRQLYAGEVAAHTGLPLHDLIRLAEQRSRRPALRVAPSRHRANSENAEFVAVALLMQRWDDIAPWLVEDLFSEDVNRRAFVALADCAGNVDTAIETCDPEAREVLERAVVADLDADPEIEALNLISAATRRVLHSRRRILDPVEVREDAEARVHLEQVMNRDSPQIAAEWLLGWLERRREDRV